jgi:deoxycytidine triphosphate deaminase
MKVSVADGLGALGKAGFWRKIELPELGATGDRESYLLKPDEFVLAMTHEKITVPPNLIAMVEGRSTYARVGLTMHQTAPWIQPGWDNTRIILEIKNNGPLNIELTPMVDRPCQLTFIRLTSKVPNKLLYGTRATDIYQNQDHPFQHQQRVSPSTAPARPARRTTKKTRVAKQRVTKSRRR